jgi:hypothetical protein
MCPCFGPASSGPAEAPDHGKPSPFHTFSKPAGHACQAEMGQFEKRLLAAGEAAESFAMCCLRWNRKFPCLVIM